MKIKQLIFLEKELRKISTFGWNCNQAPIASDSKSSSSEVKPATAPTCSDAQKCIPPNIASCTAPDKKNICVYEPCPKKRCLDDKPDPQSKMAEAEIPKGPRVIILGAGFSGLTAAARLIKAGRTNLVVLEADCRAGGRLKSRWAGDTVVELGYRFHRKSSPSWDHPLMKLGLSDGLFPPPTEGDPSSGLLDHPLPLPLIIKTYTILKKIMNEEYCKGFTKGYLALRFQQVGGLLPPQYRNEVARILTAATSLMGPKLRIEENSFGAFAVAPGGQKVPLGEAGHLIPLLETIGSEKILYRKEAVSIRWGTVTLSQTPRAIVRCRDGSEYPAEFIIISCSLGSLKSSMDSMFYPPLPSKKVAAIQDICYLQQNMAYFVFEDPIWTWSPRPVEIIPSKETDSNMDCSEDWISSIEEMKQVKGSQHVIGVRVTGPGAGKMERAPKDELMQSIHATIKKELSISEVPLPKDVIRSHWSGGYFGGYQSSSDSPQRRADLAAPLPTPDQLPPILLFAGEATSPQEGLRAAVLSGLREAERLLGIFESMPKPKQVFVCPEPCP